MDAIDRVVEQWFKEKPDLDTQPMAIMGRLMRIAKYMETRVAELHKQYPIVWKVVWPRYLKNGLC